MGPNISLATKYFTDMPIEIIIKYSLFAILIIFYLIYTVRYSLKLNKSILFSKRLRYFHLVMIWVVPFLWIFLLKNITKSAPGSFEVEKKHENEPFFDIYNIGE